MMESVWSVVRSAACGAFFFAEVTHGDWVDPDTACLTVEQLYHGIPIGTPLLWRPPGSSHTDWVIDGKQRVKALCAAFGTTPSPRHPSLTFAMQFNPYTEKFHCQRTAEDADYGRHEGWLDVSTVMTAPPSEIDELIAEVTKGTPTKQANETAGRIARLRQVRDSQISFNRANLSHEDLVECVLRLSGMTEHADIDGHNTSMVKMQRFP